MLPKNVVRQHAKRMRKNPTPHERKLWGYLRESGHKFSRQRIVMNFIADFASDNLRLIIELDGKHHERKKSYDSWRDGLLQSQGYAIVRFWNSSMDNDFHRFLVLLGLLLHKRNKQVNQETHVTRLPGVFILRGDKWHFAQYRLVDRRINA